MLFSSIYLTTPAVMRNDFRRGTVLLIVLVMLMIFSAVGLAFMFYAESEAVTASTFRQTNDFRGPEIDPELAFSMFLQQLLFDCRDDASGVPSGMRGHGMFRNMYGLNYTNAAGTVGLAPGSFVPFNGTGRLHWKHDKAGSNQPPSHPLLQGADDYDLVNYTWFPQDGFVRYPERLGVGLALLGKGGVSGNAIPYAGGANPPYTAADLNCMFLAAVQADGTVLAPSFHRDWTGFGLLDPINNPNWYSVSDATLKYKVIRPRPADHPARNGKLGFSAPADAGGDVRNRPIYWGGTGNDSIWIYAGAPILTMPDGRRYTMLFAPMIVDLDGKLNLNVAGNTRGTNKHASYQGFGPWEMNISAILSDPTLDPASGQAEWLNLFRGSGVPGQAAKLRNQGRYGASKVPGAGSTPAPFTTPPHSYAKVDYDAVTANGGAAVGPWTLPGRFQSWPTFPATYGNGLPAELLQHPSLYNSLVANAGTRIFGPGELNKIYRYGDVNTDAMLSDLFQLLPNNFKDVRKRNMITTLSFDRREPGMMPWRYNASAPNLYAMPAYAPGGPAGRPVGAPLPSPDVKLALNAATRNIGKEYGAGDWRGVLPITPRLNLNRALRPYPALNPTTMRITDMAGFGNAQLDRQTFASDIFKVLVKATGAFDIATYSKASTTTQPQGGEVDALRYLAQIAVNIVDYIDTDDYITPFNWTKAGNAAFQTDFASLPGNWVYGTEMPKVVLNEAYCHFENGSTNSSSPDYDSGLKLSPKKATFYTVDVYAELCNPFKVDPTLNEGGDARLYVPASGNLPAYSAYRILTTELNKEMHKPDNTDGHPDGKVNGTVKDADFSAKPVIKPLNGAFSAPDHRGSNVGFYFVGSSAFPLSPGATTPLPTATSSGLHYRFTIPAASPLATPPAPSLLLQRLLCPYLPPNPNPASPTYNPYITVDYFENIKVNNAANQASGDPLSPWPTSTTDTQNHLSVGRTQPFAAQATQLQNVTQTQSVVEVKNTFFYHNWQSGVSMPTWPTSSGVPAAPAGYPAFSWLVHLDRGLISPMELLHVSGYKPHELTQQFTGQMFGHQAPWFDNASRLYRFFEFVQTAPRQAGANGTRIPGKLNLNTIWDYEVFLALCDPQPGSHFTATDVARIWDRVNVLRNSASGKPGPNDQPFLPLSAGVVPVGDAQYPTYPNGLGIGNTLLRPFNSMSNTDPTQAIQARLFEPPSPPPTANPYQRYELLTKIYNNLTTRSNCFAVWVTVGFFEVNDVDATGRIYLGQEIGRSEGRNVRHKMFAIVDRSVMEGPNYPGLALNVLNGTTPFNVHSPSFTPLVPYFTVAE